MVKELNILFSYAVKWSAYKVFRELVQNMYDAAGPETFGCRFSHTYSGGTLRMCMDESFSIDWLLYMGASTKRDGGVHAGRFGEGFKVAALVAMRDFDLQVRMESQDWRMRVARIPKEVDGRQVEQLAYEVEGREDDGQTTLEVLGVKKAEYGSFLAAVESFYFAENPGLGRRISSSRLHAVHAVKEGENHGMVFASLQNRGRLAGFPLIVCDHAYTPDGDDRDREDFADGDARECVRRALARLSPAEALDALGEVRTRWDGRKRKGMFDSAKALEVLVRGVSRDDRCAAAFLEEYGPGIAARIGSGTSRNRSMMARSWFARSKYKGVVQVVSPCFKALGIKGIEELCEESNGFCVTRRPTREERASLTVIRECAEDLFSGLFSYESVPPVEIVMDNEAPVLGLAHTRKAGRREAEAGFAVKREVDKVFVGESCVKEELFGEALATYLHELLHQRGGDSDKAFHDALVDMNASILRAGRRLDEYERRWRDTFREGGTDGHGS